MYRAFLVLPFALGLFFGALVRACPCDTSKPLLLGLLNPATLPFYPLTYADAYGNSRGTGKGQAAPQCGWLGRV